MRIKQHSKKLAIFMVAATVGLGACAADRGPNHLTEQRYINRAVSSDSFEVLSSQMALQASQNSALRAFAQQMVTDHTATSQMLATTVKNVPGLAMPAPGLMLSEERAVLAQLQTSGNFDQDYLMAQVAAHDKAIALNQEYIEYGDNDALQMNAKAVLPHITQHRQMLGQTAR